MKKLFIGLLIFCAVGITITAFLPKLIPMEKIAAEAGNQVKRLTGRDLSFSNVNFIFWPNLGIELKNVTLGNPAWAKEKNMLSLDKANIALALMPLLKGHIQIKQFSLNAPVIHLEVCSDGRQNWDFTKKTATTKQEENDLTVTAEKSKNINIAFDQFKIRKGNLIFHDRQKKTTVNIANIDIEATLPDLKSTLQMEGSLTYKKKRVDLSLMLEKPADFLEGKASPGRVNLKTEDVSAKIDGLIAMQDIMLKGNIDATVVSLPSLMAWTSDGEEQKLPFEKISFIGAATLSGTDLILKNVTLALDEIRAKGHLNANFAGKPDIFARLMLDKLNLDRFTGEEEEKTKLYKKEQKKQKNEWDTTPLDLSGLNAVNADLILKTKGFSLKGIHTGPSALTVQLQNGKLDFKSSDATLLDGRFNSAMRLNAATKVPTMAFSFNMTGVQARPILASFANFGKLSGLADARVSVTSFGINQKAMISNLNGKGNAVFKDGHLKGIDLNKIIEWQKSLVASPETSETEIGNVESKTEFVELGGTFSIKNGIVKNADLKMESLLLQATGQGVVDLPQRYIQYRVVPVMLTSSSEEGTSGLSVPVIIKGHFNNIKMKPDIASAIQNIADDPEAAKKTLKNVEKEIKSLKKGIKKDPAKALQGLFKKGGLFDQ